MIDWTAHGSDFLRVAISTLLVVPAILILTRLAGLRSFSKMSPIDFAMTVAIGSLIATTILSPSPPLLLSLFSLGCVFAVQYGYSRLRLVDRIRKRAENQPLLLMDGAEVIEAALRAGEVTRADLRAKLREANVLDLRNVRAVVLESTGDISVLHANDPDAVIDGELLSGVRRL